MSILFLSKYLYLQVCGVRSVRRFENLNFLLNQAEADADDSGEVDFVELISQKNSAFAALFLEQEKMSVWTSFINSSEEEQQQVRVLDCSLDWN